MPRTYPACRFAHRAKNGISPQLHRRGSSVRPHTALKKSSEYNCGRKSMNASALARASQTASHPPAVAAIQPTGVPGKNPWEESRSLIPSSGASSVARRTVTQNNTRAVNTKTPHFQ